MILLDTTFLIDFLKGKTGTNEKLKEMSFKQLFTTRINVFEVLVGIFSLKHAEDQLTTTSAFFNSLKILELDDKSTKKSAHVAADLNNKGMSIGSLDCLIAGIALSNGINTIVTKNTKHFERINGIKAESY